MAALRGWFLPIAKNAPAADLYPKHGSEAGEATESGTCWTLDLSRAEIGCPEWIDLTVSPPGSVIADGQAVRPAPAAPEYFEAD